MRFVFCLSLCDNVHTADQQAIKKRFQPRCHITLHNARIAACIQKTGTFRADAGGSVFRYTALDPESIHPVYIIVQNLLRQLLAYRRGGNTIRTVYSLYPDGYFIFKLYWHGVCKFSKPYDDLINNHKRRKGGVVMAKRKNKKIKKDINTQKAYTGEERREYDDPTYFGYFLLEGRERRWSENMIVNRMEKAISEVLARLHDYKHLAPYGTI